MSVPSSCLLLSLFFLEWMFRAAFPTASERPALKPSQLSSPHFTFPVSQLSERPLVLCGALSADPPQHFSSTGNIITSISSVFITVAQFPLICHFSFSSPHDCFLFIELWVHWGRFCPWPSLPAPAHPCTGSRRAPCALIIAHYPVA